MFKVSYIFWSLLFIATISSFLWFSGVIKAVENGYAKQEDLSYFQQFGLMPILYDRLNSYKEQDKEWSNIAKFLAKRDGELAFKLAKPHIEQQGNGRNNESSAELWLLQAIRLKHQQARLLLAKLYIKENKYNAAKNLLLPIKTDAFALKLLIEISIVQGVYSEIENYSQQLIANASLNKHQALQNFKQKLSYFNITKPDNRAYGASCLATIAPFATNLKNLEYFSKLILSNKLSPLMPYICFSPVTYVSKQELDCWHNENEAISCNEAIWQNNQTLAKGDNHYVAVMVEKGGANVNSGILYIDGDDSAEVFLHELAHLLGFIDEYALPENHYRCLSVQSSMFSHNIAVIPRYYQGSKESARQQILKRLPWAKYIESTTALVRQSEQGWRLGTIDKMNQGQELVGAYLAETCNERDFVAVKPLKIRTTMRYYETQFPSLYLQLLADNPEKFLMPNYQHNVIKALKELK